MKRFLIGLILALFLAVGVTFSGCVHLAVNPEEEPTFDEILELAKILDEVDYRDWKYESDVFDCSNMSAYLYDYLTARGYDCEIVVGAVYPWGFFIGQCHAWLIAHKNGKKFLVESVKKRLASAGDFRKYLFRFSFGSLEKARKFYRIFGSENEWDY